MLFNEGKPQTGTYIVEATIIGLTYLPDHHLTRALKVPLVFCRLKFHATGTFTLVPHKKGCVPVEVKCLPNHSTTRMS